MNTTNITKLPPGPKTKIPLGHLFPFQRDSLAFLKKIANEFGDIVHFKVGPIRVVLLNHPDYIKEVLSTQNSKGRPLKMAKELIGEGLLTSEGEFHKRQSRIIQPAFHRKMLESYAPAMTECTINLMNSWEDGLQVDMFEEMIRMSTAISGKTLFNVDTEQETPEINQALQDVMSLFGRISLPFSEWLFKLPLRSTRKFYSAKARLDDTIHRIIAERRQSKIEHEDLLSLLLQAQDSAEGMSDQQIRDEALTLFLTAFDTTSIALTWTWYLLSQNPDAETKLHEELDQVLQGRIPTVEDLSQLKYTRMVLGESMRIYPPIYLITRQALEDFEVGPYIVPADTIVLMSPYLIHHDARFRQNPEAFDPYAWEEHAQGISSKYEYFAGARARVLASRMPGWKGCWCWLPLLNPGD
jgi:cytochrome P450